MFAFGMPGGVEWLVIALIVFFVFILPLTLLGIVVAVLAKKRKTALDEESRNAASQQVRQQDESALTD